MMGYNGLVHLVLVFGAISSVLITEKAAIGTGGKDECSRYCSEKGAVVAL